MKKKVLKSSAVVVLAIILLAVNVLALFVPSIDLSTTGRIKMGEVSQKYLANLDKEIEIYVVKGASDDAKFERFMKDYAKSSDKIKLEFVELSDAAELLALCGYTASDGVSSYAVVVKSDKRAKLLDYHSLFYYQTNWGNLSYSQYLQ